MTFAISVTFSQPWSASGARSSARSTPARSRLVSASAKRSQQEQPRPEDDSSDYLGDFFADSPKWRWPFSSRGPQSGLESAAKRLYNNKDLRALVEQEQAKERAGRWSQEQPPPPPPSQQAQPKQQQQQQQQASQGSSWPDPWADPRASQPRRGPSNPEPPPPPPSFFASKEETMRYLKWMEGQRAKAVKQAQGRPDDEVAGIAKIYLVVAVVIIVLGLLRL